IVVERGQDGHGHDLGGRQGLHRSLDGGGAGRRMHGQQVGPDLGNSTRRAAYGRWYVVQLEVEEDIRAPRPPHRCDRVRPEPQVQLKPDLERADMRADKVGPAGRRVQVGRIERDGDRGAVGHVGSILGGVVVKSSYQLLACVRYVMLPLLRAPALVSWARPATSAIRSMPRRAGAWSSSRRILAHADGSWKIAVPTLTMDAPASISSRASRPVITPPIPMIGTPGSASCTCQMQRTAIGLTAGPDKPPVRPAS